MTIGIVHATMAAVATLTATFQEIDPKIGIVNFVNEELLARSNRMGGIDEQGIRNFLRLTMMAAESDVDGIIIACSMYSTYASMAQKLTVKPVFAIDGPMICHAARTGNRIGIIATNPPAGALEEKKIRAAADELMRTIETFVEIRSDAAEAIKAGHIDNGNRMIREAGEILTLKGCDMIILSQITMAGARGCMLDLGPEILSSPQSGAEFLIQKLS